MKKNTTPKARNEGLVIQEMPDEILIYDLEKEKAHCLNETASAVWNACDGKSNVSEIAKKIQTNGNEDIVWLAIDQLQENNLLEDDLDLNLFGKTRRELLKKVGLATAIALPIVSSLTAPSSVLASSSCSCTTLVDCTSVPGCPSVTCTGFGVCASV